MYGAEPPHGNPGDGSPGVTIDRPCHMRGRRACARRPSTVVVRGVVTGTPRPSGGVPPPPTAILILEPPSYPHDTMARRVRVQQLPNGQFVVTIPKALAEAIGFRKGEEVQWSLEKEALVLRRLTRKR